MNDPHGPGCYAAGTVFFLSPFICPAIPQKIPGSGAEPQFSSRPRPPKSRNTKESHCLYGPSFLVFERSQGVFLEFFCGNKSSRSEAKNICSYLPLTQADIDARAARGEDVNGLVPHGPLPLTLKSRLVEKGPYSWHIPLVAKCNEPFTNLPGMDQITKEIAAFLAVIDKSVERATAADGRAR